MNITDKMQTTVVDTKLKMKLRSWRYFFTGMATLLTGSLITTIVQSTPENFNKPLLLCVSCATFVFSVLTLVVESVGLRYGIRPDEIKELNDMQSDVKGAEQ